MKLLNLITLLTMSATPLIAKEHKQKEHRHSEAHVHGLAKAMVVTEKKQLHISFEIPAHDLLGFESFSKDSKVKKEQKDLLKSVEAKLKDSSLVVDPSSKASCLKTKANVKTELGKGGHGDFDIEYEFTCEKIEKLKSLRFTIFKSFPTLRKINVTGEVLQKSISENVKSRSPLLELKN